MADAQPGIGRKAFRVAVVGALLAVIGYGVWRADQSPPPDEPEPAPGAGHEAAPATAAESAPAHAPDGGAPAVPPAPTFDLLRVEPDGSAVVAGRAAPGARVTVLGEAGPLAEAEADASGEFVAIFRAPPGAGPQALSLEAEAPDGATTGSEDMVVLLPAPAEAAPEEAAPGPAADAAVAAAGPDGEAGAPPASAAARSPEAEPAEAEAENLAAAAILRPEGVEATPLAADDGGLALASVSYGETGHVTLAGLGAAGARIRVYVDDRFARDATVGEDGRWSLELADVATGVYRLRIDALRADGTVEARLETPFQRDIPAAAGDDGRASVVVVQPGNNLWTLARIHYGRGVLYTQIYTANRELIRDPELIYPGQVFVLPEGAAQD